MNNSDDPWRRAAELLQPMGSIAGNFTSAVRTLLNYHERGITTLTAGVQTHMLRILRNSTVKATYFFASKAYRPELLTQHRAIKPKDFLNLYSPFEHAVILSYCYLFRALAKKSKKEEWEYVQSPLYEALEIGACIGARIPEVGLGIGLLSRGLRYLAFAALLMKNEKSFVQYRKHLRAKDLPFDLDKEVELWGCTNIHIAALMMEYIGFNRNVGNQFVAAAMKDTVLPGDTLYGVPFRIAETLLDSFTERGELPEQLPSWVGSTLRFSKEQRTTLLQDLSRVVSSTERIEWLNTSSSSINPDSTPELFEEGGTNVEALTK
jgi:hypothetical protein